MKEEECLGGGPRHREVDAASEPSPRSPLRQPSLLDGDSEPAKAIVVELYHGNLAFIQAPVVLGHYEGDALVGSEATLDRLLDGCLSRRRRLGLYPGSTGTVHTALPDTDRESRAMGAVIVGLGKVGELKPDGLQVAFRQAVLEFGLALSDSMRNSTGVTVPATLAAPLLGSGDKGVSIEESLQAMLEATLSANRDLEAADLRCPVWISKLQFVELYLDFAVEAGQVLRSLLSRGAPGRFFDFQGGVRRLAGGLWRVLPARSQSWWQRLEVRGEAGGRLTYLPGSKSAGTPKHQAVHQVQQVDDIKQALLNLRAGPDWLDKQASLAMTLRHLLLPSEFRKYGPHRSNLLLVLNQEAARVPWELVYYERPSLAETFTSTGGDGVRREALRPLALVTGVVRQMVTERVRQRVVPAGGSHVLIIGDPAGSQGELPGAQEEAKGVSELCLQNGLQVRCLVRESSREILQALMARPYRLVHLAGHGAVHQILREELPATDSDPATCPPPRAPPLATPRRVTGMVLDNGSYLTANELDRLGRIPELVFVNCCHLGQVPDHPEAESIESSGLLAASFASHLIEMGVRSVVAAAWKVNDRAAKTFATTFYRRMLAGKPFGEAILAARQQTAEGHPDTNTWAAYQAYGDPHYRLRLPATVGQLPPIPESFVDKDELLAELNNLVSLAATTSEKGLLELSNRLESLLVNLPDEWRDRSDVRVAIAQVWRELDQIDEALENYTVALAINKSTISIRSLEQRCNLLSHQAIRRWRDPLDKAFTPRSAREQLATCEQLLLDLPRTDGSHRLDETLMTAERLNLLAVLYKRRSLLAPARQRRKFIERTTELYRRAFDLHLEQSGSTDLYPYLKYLSGRMALALRGEEPLDDDFAEQLGKGRAALEERLGQPSFWNLVDQVEIEWLGRLQKADIQGHLDDLSRGLSEHWIRAGTLRQARAVFEHLYWMQEMVEPPGKSATTVAPQRVAAFKALQQLCWRFEAAVGQALDDRKWSGFHAHRQRIRVEVPGEDGP